jgi:hypothetical protein
MKRHRIQSRQSINLPVSPSASLDHGIRAAQQGNRERYEQTIKHENQSHKPINHSVHLSGLRIFRQFTGAVEIAAADGTSLPRFLYNTSIRKMGCVASVFGAIQCS